jgi:acyl carrier protein
MDNGSVSNSNNFQDHRVIAIVYQILRERSISNSQPIHKEHKLTDCGLTSLDLARLVLLVEDEFDLRIPVRELIPTNFRSVSSISHLITRLTDTPK